MGKRSSFERIPRDFYPTPQKAVIPLLEHLPLFGFSYVEPCMGKGDLIQHLSSLGGSRNVEGDPYSYCVYGDDISFGKDALTLTKEECGTADYIITNPPWDRKILHPMIEHFRQLLPTWLLFDSDWAHTKQAIPYLTYCHKIVSVGRVKWIPDSKMTGKDNCTWYLFKKQKAEEGTKFYGRL